MNSLLEERNVRCPCCGEKFTTLVDLSAGARTYTEDCPVCCNPLELELRFDAGGEQLELAVRPGQ